MLHELPGVDDVIRKLVLVTEAESADRGDLVDSEVGELERMLGAAREAGAETTEVEALLQKAQSSLDSDMELAWQLLSKAKVQVQESREKFVDRMKVLVEQTGEAVDQLRGLGADAGPAEILLKDAREAFEAGRYEKVEEVAQNVRGMLERVQTDAAAKRVESDLSELIHEIEQARNDGVDATRAEAFLVKIEDALQRKNFRAVDDHLRRARDSLRDERKKAILKRSTEEMERLTAMLVEAKTFGAEAAEAEGLLLRAREALAEGRAEEPVHPRAVEQGEFGGEERRPEDHGRRRGPRHPSDRSHRSEREEAGGDRPAAQGPRPGAARHRDSVSPSPRRPPVRDHRQQAREGRAAGHVPRRGRVPHPPRRPPDPPRVATVPRFDGRRHLLRHAYGRARPREEDDADARRRRPEAHRLWREEDLVRARAERLPRLHRRWRRTRRPPDLYGRHASGDRGTLRGAAHEVDRIPLGARRRAGARPPPLVRLGDP